MSRRKQGARSKERGARSGEHGARSKERGATAPVPSSICKRCGAHHYGLAFVMCCECQKYTSQKSAKAAKGGVS
jgi:hypothetical protein